jgi:Tol biopolymer transport system component
MRKSHGLRSLSWSPDGFRLLFQEGYGPYWIYTVNIDGSNLTRVTQGTDPAWSQDRLRISFTRFGRTSHLAGQIWVANPDGSGARPVDPTVANNGSSGPWIRPAS